MSERAPKPEHKPKTRARRGPAPQPKGPDAPRPAAATPSYVWSRSPHPASLDETSLLRDCEVNFGRMSGPGGQHRNKVETYVTIIHAPTQVKASAGERRKQGENRRMAFKRLRLGLARQVRTKVPWRDYRPTELWKSRRQGKQLSINPKHGDYAPLLAEALDVIVTKRYDVAGAAGLLGVSMSQLARLVRHDKHAFTTVNTGRRAQGLPPLK